MMLVNIMGRKAMIQVRKASCFSTGVLGVQSTRRRLMALQCIAAGEAKDIAYSSSSPTTNGNKSTNPRRWINTTGALRDFLGLGF